MAIERRPPPGKPPIDRKAEDAETVDPAANTGGVTEMAEQPQAPNAPDEPAPGIAMQANPGVYMAYKVFFKDQPPKEDNNIFDGIYDLDTRMLLNQAVATCMQKHPGCVRLVPLFWHLLKA